MMLRHSYSLVLALIVTSVPLGACGANGHAAGESSDAGPIEECEAFVAAYEHCLDSLGPERIAKARIEQTRAGLMAQASQGEAARASLREQCSANLSQIKTTCR